MMEFHDLSAEIFSTAQQLQSKRLLLESNTLYGVPEGTRTPDPRIKSPLLYQLSYEHMKSALYCKTRNICVWYAI